MPVNYLWHRFGVATERRLFFLLHQAHRAIVAHANTQTLDQLGVSSTQLALIYYVAKHPGCSLTEVANLFDLNKSAVSGVVQRLERSQIILRKPNPLDGRGSLLYITDKGEAVRAQSLPVLRRLTAELTRDFDEQEVATIFRFLNSIVDRYAERDRDDDLKESP